MKAAEREERDANALKLFVAGATYRQIGAAIGLKSTHSIHVIITKALAASAQRRALLTDEAFAIHQERTERLFQAHWGPALKGDHRSAEICRRLLGQEARLYGLEEINQPLPAPTAPLRNQDEDEESNDLARMRARRNAAG